MLSRFGGGLFGIIIICVSGGILTHNPYLIIVSLPLVIYLTVATLLYRLDDLNAKREIIRKDTLFEKDSIEIVFEIEGNFRGILTLVQEITTPHQTIEIKKSIGKKKTIREKVKLGSFGIYTIHPFKIIYSDFLGIFYREFTFSSKEVIKVYPQIEKVKSVAVNPKTTVGVFGDILSEYKGKSTEFYEIREYSSGDSYKSINWKCFARLQKPMVNEKYDERSANIVIFLDLRYAGNLFDKFIKAACSLSVSLLRMRNRVGLIAVGKSIIWIYPKSGKLQSYIIMDALSEIERGRSMIKAEHLSFLLRRFFPRGCYIIFISALRDKKMEEILWEMIARGHRVLLINPYEKIEDDSMGKKIQKIQRIFTVKRFRRFIPVIEWDVSKPLESSLALYRRIRYG